MGTRTLIVIFDNGTRFEVDPFPIAEDRAVYHASVDNSGRSEEEVIEEEMTIVEDQSELEYWMKNHMEWADIEDWAEKLSGGASSVGYDYHGNWDKATVCYRDTISRVEETDSDQQTRTARRQG